MTTTTANPLHAAILEEALLADDGSLFTVIQIRSYELRIPHEDAAEHRSASGELRLNELLDDWMEVITDEISPAFAAELLGDMFDDFSRSYMLAAAFTGFRYAGHAAEPVPLVEGPGDISQYADPDTVLSWLSDNDREQLLIDCLDFYIVQYSRICHDPDRAGSNFHFSRNRHGAGFFNGWQLFDGTEWGLVLQEAAKAYGTSELTAYGMHIDHDFGGWQGPDADLETSLFEYGLIWLHIDRSWRFYFPVTHGAEGMFDWGEFDDDTDIIEEFNGIEWLEFFDSRGCDEETFREMPLPQQVYELFSHYGAETVFGPSQTEGQRIFCDDTLKVEVTG